VEISPKGPMVMIMPQRRVSKPSPLSINRETKKKSKRSKLERENTKLEREGRK